MALGAFSLSAQQTLPLPFHDDFEHHDNVSLIDSNNDFIGFGLNYNPSSGSFDSFVYDGREAVKTADDWMIFPYFNFEEGLVYTLSVSLKCSGTGTADFQVFMGQGGDDMDDLEIRNWIAASEPWILSNDAVDAWQTHSLEFTAPVTGCYRMALHFTSAAKQKYSLDWLTLSEGMVETSPVAPSVATPTYTITDGKLMVKFNVTAPTSDWRGNAISAPMTARIERRAEGHADSSFTIENVAPGASAEFTDPDGIGKGAEYDVRMVNGTAVGAKTIVKATPQYTTPKAPTGVAITRTAGNHFSASWDAVVAGVSSFRLFNPATVTYAASFPDGTPVELTMTGVTSAEFDYPEPTEKQIGAFINLAAVNEAGAGSATSSNTVVLGPALAGAFAESFSNGAFHNEVWNSVPAKAWTVSKGTSATPAQDGDSGVVRYAQSSGLTGELISPYLDLSGMEKPYVRLYMFKKPASTFAASFDVFLRADIDNEEYMLASGLTDHNLPEGDANPSSDGWREYLWPVNIPAEKAARCNLVIRGTGVNSYTYVYFDNISINDFPVETDASISGVTGSGDARVGKPYELTVNVANTGVKNIGQYTLQALSDGEVIAEAAGIALRPFADGSVKLSVTPAPHQSGTEIPLEIKISAQGDENAENDVYPFALYVEPSLLPAVETLVAERTENGVLLSWGAPEPGTSGMTTVNEDFSTWDEGALNGDTGNGWSFIDIDGLPTKGWGTNDPAYRTTIGAEVYSQGGESESAGIIVPNCYGTNGALYGTPDKWIILPELDPGSTVTLSRGAVNCFGNSSAVKIDYVTSSDSREPESFINVLESENINSRTLAAWTQKSFTLPSDARFFAIHVKDCQAKYVGFDNFSFTQIVGAPMLEGFRIYCDGKAVGQTDAQTLQYEHLWYADDMNIFRLPVAEEYNFYVSALYDQGESAAGNSVGIQTGVDGINADGKTVLGRYTLDGRIAPAGYKGTVIVRYTDGTVRKLLLK